CPSWAAPAVSCAAAPFDLGRLRVPAFICAATVNLLDTLVQVPALEGPGQSSHSVSPFGRDRSDVWPVQRVDDGRTHRARRLLTKSSSSVGLLDIDARDGMAVWPPQSTRKGETHDAHGSGTGLLAAARRGAPDGRPRLPREVRALDSGGGRSGEHG